jgi:ABC-type cobalamin/Fe3+-siderophores transport system ATPase subunit
VTAAPSATSRSPAANTLSGGEKQRVLIAQAIAQGADQLILDEPTNHLGIRCQVEISASLARSERASRENRPNTRSIAR